MVRKVWNDEGFKSSKTDENLEIKPFFPQTNFPIFLSFPMNKKKQWESLKQKIKDIILEYFKIKSCSFLHFSSDLLWNEKNGRILWLWKWNDKFYNFPFFFFWLLPTRPTSLNFLTSESENFQSSPETEKKEKRSKKMKNFLDFTFTFDFEFLSRRVNTVNSKRICLSSFRILEN